eukprot:COSAG06_NODE_5838_length_3250_cov_27.950492_1_plen_392_part_00
MALAALTNWLGRCSSLAKQITDAVGKPHTTHPETVSGADIDIEAGEELDARAAAARRAPRWVPDADAPSCMLCDMVFWRAGPAAWTRHHCQSCGWVVCLACMPKDQVLPLGRWLSSTAGHPLECGAPMKEQRVCNSCVPAARAAAEAAAAENAALWLELTDIDEVLVNICRFLGLRELGRLACAARRFTEPTLTEPTLTEPGGAQLLSPIEEGARLRLAAAAGGGGGSGGSEASGGAAALRLAGDTWVRALWRVESRLRFTSCGPAVVLSKEGALRLRAAERAAAATRCLTGGARAWAPAPARIHSGAGYLRCSGRGGRAVRAVLCVRSPLSPVPAVCLTLFCACVSAFSFPCRCCCCCAQAPWRRRANTAASSPRCAPSTRWSRARTTWR